MSFMQLLLIYAGNLPEEVIWYVRRIHGGWLWVGISLAVFQFALPLLLLLRRDVKQDARRLLAVAALILLMRIVNEVWLLMPGMTLDVHPVTDGWKVERTFGHTRLLALTVPLGLLGVGGVWLGVFLGRLRRHRLSLRPALALEAHHG
jgi:hypothetical protein